MDILDHPFLRTECPDPPLLTMPAYDLPNNLKHKLSHAVLQDLCFLAYLNGDLYLCETSARIKERVYGERPCWEKRWAQMLAAWKERDDMGPTELVRTVAPAGSEHRVIAESSDLTLLTVNMRVARSIVHKQAIRHALTDVSLDVEVSHRDPYDVSTLVT